MAKTNNANVPRPLGSSAPKKLPVLKYSEILEKQLADSPPKRKGGRTRARLKLSAAKVLEQVGYKDMRVSDICDGADIKMATFYLYFPNKSEITREVLSDFLEAIASARAAQDQSDSTFDSLVSTNLHFMRAFEANAGLIRCLLQYGDEEPEFTKLWEARGHQWYEHVAKRLATSKENPEVDESVMLLSTYALGGMMDQIFRDLYVNRNPFLTSVVKRATPNTDDLATFLARLWYRATFGRDPIRKEELNPKAKIKKERDTSSLPSTKSRQR
jgi:TetR/AcrR family transcriptional repressor of nem operon